MKKYNRRYTGIVKNLGENEVLVYANAPDGRFLTKSPLAQLAKQFGAQFGEDCKEGMTSDKTYAIPCYRVDESREGQDNCAAMRESVHRFIHYAAMHPDLVFLVPTIGMGGIFKNPTNLMASMFREAMDLENVILPSEFVLQLEAEDEAGVFNLLVASSDDRFLDQCRSELADKNIRIVKVLRSGKEMDDIGPVLIRQEDLPRSVDAVVYDPAIPESSDEAAPFSGLGSILSVEAAVNYHVHVPFICLSSLSLDEIREGCGLAGSLVRRMEKAYQPMDRMAVVKDIILKIDSQDSRIRKENAELFEAADWYDATVRTSNGGSVAGFISSVLRENTADLANRTRSFLHEIVMWLVGRGALPDDRQMNPGSYMDLIRDGRYKIDDRHYYYMVSGGHEIPRRLRFMLEAVKENGNAGSHSTDPLDTYINRSVFYAFSSFLLWLYRERDYFEGGVNDYYDVQDMKEFLPVPYRGALSVTQVDGKSYYFCGRVHLEPKDGQPMVPGSRIVIMSVGREKAPRVKGVTLFANAGQWETDAIQASVV